MKKIIVHCDGGSRGNPGPSAIGIVIYDEKYNLIEDKMEFIGTTTNNVAEYKSLIKAFELLKKYCPDEIIINMDSELVINQLKGLYKVKNERLIELYQKVKIQESFFNKVSYNHVPRENIYQTKADLLVNKALDLKKNINKL